MSSASATLRPLTVFFAVTLSSACAQGGTPVFNQSRYIPQVSATPVHREAPSEPLPQGWLIAGAIVVLLILIGLLYAASKAWRSANLFARKYRFPPAGSAALRFGGNRSGGFMAAIETSEEKHQA